MLSPQQHAHLVKVWYGILMMLPQSDVHTRLKTRLETIPGIVMTMSQIEPNPKKHSELQGAALRGIDHAELVEQFKRAQAKNTAALVLEQQNRLKVAGCSLFLR